MKRSCCMGLKIVGLLAAMVAPIQSAVTLEEAASLWRFDMPTGVALGSTVSSAQIKDSAGIYTAASISGAVQWTAVSQPSTGSVGPSSTGLSFNPVVETLNPGASVYDSIRSSLVEINHPSVAVRGNSAVLTRIMWDGRIAGSDDGPSGNQYWLLRNGYSGSGQGFLLGLRSPDSDPTKATLQYFTYQGAGGIASVSSTFTLQSGVWYDIGLVMNDGGDISTYADNSVTFYAHSTEFGWQKSEHLGMYLSNNPTSTVYLGSEDKGVSSVGNQRKSFDGTMDYLALFNQSLQESDVRALLIPEPRVSVLLMIGVLGVMIRRRRVASF